MEGSFDQKVLSLRKEEIKEACKKVNPSKQWVVPCPCGCVYDRVEDVSLADVLLVLREKKPFAVDTFGIFWNKRTGMNVGEADEYTLQWDLKKDSLGLQREEVVEFIHKLLNV